MSLRFSNRSPRTMIVGLALVLAAGAAGTSWAYLNSVQTRAYHGAKLTSVYVVSGPVPQGTTGAALAHLIKKGEIPTQYRPADAITDLATIQGEQTLTNLTTGEVLSSGLFATPSHTTATGPAAAIPTGDVAITVSVDPVHGVAGLIEAGDQVDVLVSINTNTERFLYQNVPVLAVGSQLASTATDSTVDPPSTTAATPTSSLITFAVPPAAAERIALAESDGAGVTGSLYLALVAPGEHASATGAVGPNNLIPANLSPQ